MLWVLEFIVRGSDSVAGQVLQYISVTHRYDDFTRGIIDTSSLIYYVSVPILFHLPYGALDRLHSLETRMKPKPSGPINRHGWAELAATIGAACLIAGYLRFTIQGEWMRASEVLAIGGGVLLLAGIAFGFDAILAFFSKRSSRLGTNTTILTMAVLAILVIVNFVGYRHHKTFDLTTEKLYTLSDQTRKIVRGLTQDVTIMRFAKGPDPQFDNLMTQYRNLSPHSNIRMWIPQEKPDVAREYGVAQHGRRDCCVRPPQGNPARNDGRGCNDRDPAR